MIIFCTSFTLPFFVFIGFHHVTILHGLKTFQKAFDLFSIEFSSEHGVFQVFYCFSINGHALPSDLAATLLDSLDCPLPLLLTNLLERLLLDSLHTGLSFNLCCALVHYFFLILNFPLSISNTSINCLGWEDLHTNIGSWRGSHNNFGCFIFYKYRWGRWVLYNNPVDWGNVVIDFGSYKYVWQVDLWLDRWYGRRFNDVSVPDLIECGKVVLDVWPY